MAQTSGKAKGWVRTQVPPESRGLGQTDALGQGQDQPFPPRLAVGVGREEDGRRQGHHRILGTCRHISRGPVRCRQKWWPSDLGKEGVWGQGRQEKLEA